MIIDLVGKNFADWFLAIGLFGALFTSLWASIKVSYEKIKGKPFPSNGATLVIDIIVDLLPNLPGMIHQVAKSQGSRLFMSPKSSGGATFNVTAKLAEGFDPNKVADAFAKELESKAQDKEDLNQ
jgi:hypothetical protein